MVQELSARLVFVRPYLDDPAGSNDHSDGQGECGGWKIYFLMNVGADDFCVPHPQLFATPLSRASQTWQVLTTFDESMY